MLAGAAWLLRPDCQPMRRAHLSCAAAIDVARQELGIALLPAVHIEFRYGWQAPLPELTDPPGPTGPGLLFSNGDTGHVTFTFADGSRRAINVVRQEIGVTTAAAWLARFRESDP